jgi:hypothetical protein
MVTVIRFSTNRGFDCDFSSCKVYNLAATRIIQRPDGKSDERRKEENLHRDESMHATSLGDLVEVVRSIGRERAQILERAKDALTKGDEAGAIELFRELLGVESPSVGS